LISTKLKIPNGRGELLSAVMDEPAESEPIAYAIFAHCFTCSKELKAIVNINCALTEHDIAVLRFDMTGIGESEGNFTDTNFTTQLADFDAVSKYVSVNYEPPSLAIGHSLGGCVAVYSAIKNRAIKGAVIIGSPSEPSNLSIKLRRTKQQCKSEGTAVRDIGGVKYKFSSQFFDDIETYHMQRDIPKLHKPLLILHSPLDTYSSIDNAETTFRNANQPKSLISLDDIDHLMLKKHDANYVGQLIGTWFEKYCSK
jgi:alpha-beta hydrolase superfamily lysophospholipase